MFPTFVQLVVTQIPEAPIRRCDGFGGAGVSPAPCAFLIQNCRPFLRQGEQDAGATSIQKIDEHFVRNGQPVRRQSKAGSIPFDQALSAQFFHARLQIGTVFGLDTRKIDPGKLPQAQE